MLSKLSNLKKLKIALLVLALLISLIGLFYLFPKNISRIWIFAIVLAGDLFLWNSYKLIFKRNSGSPFYFFRVYYWFPEFLLIASLFLSLFINSVDAQSTVSTFIIGIAMMVLISKFVSFLVLIIESIIRFFDWLTMCYVDGKINFKLKPTRKKIVIKISFWTMIFLTIVFFTGIVNTFRFEVKKVEIYSKNLPTKFSGLKIVQFSDLHLVSLFSEQQLKNAVDAINNQEADIVVFTGDLVSYKAKELDKYKHILSTIKANYGVYAILGNHDYGDYVNWKNESEKVENMTKLVQSYLDMGWTLLRNENRRIFSVDSTQSIVIVGVENWSSNSRFGTLGDIDKAMMNVAADDFTLLLSHDPSHWDYLMMKDYPIDLTLSGHTHAMQFGIDCCGIKWSPISIISPKWSGLYEQQNFNKKSSLYINVGLGNVGFISRVGFLPEITVITLHAEPK